MPEPGDVEQTVINDDDENLDNDNLRHYCLDPGKREDYDLDPDTDYYLNSWIDWIDADYYLNPWMWM